MDGLGSPSYSLTCQRCIACDEMSRKGKNKPPDNRSHLAKRGQSTFPRERYVAAAVCGLLLLAVALVFAQTMRHGFIGYDDLDYVRDNPQVAGGFTAPGIGWAFAHFHSGNWHPLTWLSHTLDCQLYGLNYPGGHHLTSVLLHAANAILLFLVLRQMSGGLWPSALVATLFAIHPLHVETVAWVAERKDVLSGLFFMLTLAAYAGYARRPFSLLRYLLVTALFALGLMAKPMLVTLPFVLLLLDYWPLGRIGAGSGERGAGSLERGAGSKERGAGIRDARLGPRHSRHGLSSLISHPSSLIPSGFLPAPRSLLPAFLEKLPLMALAAVSCVVTYSAQGTALADVQRLSFSSRMANALVSCAAYLGQVFYPVGLAAFYPHPHDSLPVAKVVGAGLLLVGISLAVLVYRRKCPYLLVGWLWYLGMLVPVIGLVQVGSQAMADRYTYLTQIGLCIALVWANERVLRGWAYRRWASGATAAVIMTILVCCAWQQVSYWKDDETLWTRALACTSENFLACSSLGTVMAERGQFDEAIALYEEALRIRPDYAHAHTNLGLALARRGQVDEAISHYQAALKIEPNYAAALNNLAWIRATHPDAKFRNGLEAVALAHRAVELSPSDAGDLDTLAAAYAEAGRFAEALETARKALDLAVQQNKQALAESVQDRIRLYAAGKPFREPPSAPAETSLQP